MRLLIISNMAHYYRDGQLVGHGPTAREISHLAQIFEDITHVACLHNDTNVPDLALPYDAENIRFIPLPPAGGKSLLSKLNILKYVPIYIYHVLCELPKADVVHIRAPANIPLIAMIILVFVRHPRKRWIKYAGNWSPDKPDALSYRFQRWWLKKGWHRGVVTVNGEWPDSPEHIRTFFNPCLTQEEIFEGNQCANHKVLKMPFRFIFVGRVDEAKGARQAVEIIYALKRQSIPVSLDIIGDGSTRNELEKLNSNLDLSDSVQFRGSMPRHEINEYYRNSHFILFPSRSEGWPKVLSEAMAFGVVPLTGNVSSIPQYLDEFNTGNYFDPSDVQGFIGAIENYLEYPDIWKKESQNAINSVSYFSYDYYVSAVISLLELSEQKQ